MKRVELKRVAEILWKGTPADEKTPFAGQGTLPDNGSFSKNLDSGDLKKSKEFLESGEEKNSEPMSIPRKFCFVMSFNLWILYFLALAWLIPCRNLECGLDYPDVVKVNLSDISRLTNVEAMNLKGLPSLVMIGYSAGTELKLSALTTSDATFVWNNSLPFVPRNIQCDFKASFDVNGDGIADCLLSGFYDVYAFNASDGHVFWHRSIPSEGGEILSHFHPTNTRNGRSFLVGTYGDKLLLMDARNGSSVTEISLPCDDPFDIKVVPNHIHKNFTFWSLVCDYGDKIEVWSFGEKDVLNAEKSEKNANISEFALLYNGTNFGGSIDLGCDVTPIPGGPLLLSWSDRVVMVTQEAIAWERHFPEPLTVAAIEFGHFSSTKEPLIAAAVHNTSNTIVYMMEMKNGTTVHYVMLHERQVQSMDKIADDFDFLVLKSLFFNYTSVISNTSDPVPTERTNFALLDFSSGSWKIRDIANTSIRVASTINMQTNGETDLILVESEGGFSSYQKYILHDIDSQDNAICLVSSRKHHHYSFEA